MNLVEHYANIAVYRGDSWMEMVQRLARALQAVRLCKEVVDEEKPPSSESLQALVATRSSAHGQAMNFIKCVIDLSGSRTNPGRRRDFIVIKSGYDSFLIESPAPKQAAPAIS